MKHCLKSQPEPPALATYRQNNPNADWDQFRGEQPACYALLRDTLRRDQGGLCAYCELDVTAQNEQIGHFHPKSDTNGAINWALCWENLWLACKGGDQRWMTDPNCYLPPLPDNISCDVKKRDHILDGLVLAPNEVPTFPRIFRYEQFPDRIDIHPDERGCQEAGVPLEKARRTIIEFNLNCSRLAKARLSLLRQLEQAVKKLQASNIDPRRGLSSLAQTHLAKKDNACWPRFMTLIRWRFGRFAEEYLLSIQYEG